jgi:hypothetical protein
MKRTKLNEMTVNQLVDRFMILALDQDHALLGNEIRKVNRLFDQLESVEKELKARPGDQRSALVALYKHPNPQVRVKAIKATLAVAPEARPALQDLANSREYPQSGEAGMCVWNLERGFYMPT